MTLGTGDADRDYEGAAQAIHDRGLAEALSGSNIGAYDNILEVYAGFDPSDGANVGGGSSYSQMMPLGPSSAGLAGLMGVNDPQAQHPQVLKEIAQLKKYMASLGTPWPTPTKPYTLRSTVAALPGNINKGWNAASQPGAAPGMVIRDVALGSMSWEEALNYTPAPLTDNLGSLMAAFKEPGPEDRNGYRK